jgi:GTP-binding protein
VPTAAPARMRTDLRNVAIVAHVDHGKTTLVDAMLRQSGAVAGRTELDRVLDSGDLEREKGITILAKNTAVTWPTPDGPVTINVVDTPGHADFGGEVERGLSMVDGVLLLVDASEGPLPQTRFVLRKALAAHLPVVLVINKVDRPDARIVAVVEETHDLLLDLAADLETDAAEQVLDMPVLYASARAGRASRTRPRDGEMPDAEDLTPLFDAILAHVPPPDGDVQAPLQAHVTNLDASSFLGRIALCRIRAGRLHKGQTVAWCREDGSIRPVKITELLRTEGLERVPAASAKAGDLIAIAGIAEITIGDTLADVDDPRPLPRITVDEPVIAMTIGINTSPLAGRGGGRKLTARLVRNRLEAELVGNVSIRISPTGSPDTWEVRGRGELALAVLVETMRREGFELTVGKPQVVTRIVDGVQHEPYELLTIDVPDEYVGAVTELLAARKGRLEQLGAVSGDGWVRLEFTVPSRGLIGLRTEFLTVTRGTGIAHHVFDGYRRWAGELRTRRSGSLVADRPGAVTGYALAQLADRGAFFVEPGAAVYAGMVVGENPRAEDLDINVCRERKLTNMRSSTGEELERLARPRILGLEEALEFCAADECVEVAPDMVRVRKAILDPTQRARQRARDRAARA